MSPRAGRVALAVALIVGLLAVSIAPAAVRRHRLKVPPRPALPRALSVDEVEWAVTPSRKVVSSGRVTINVYNRGMDDHDFVIENAAGAELGKAFLQPGGSDQVVVVLPPGEYKLVCSLFRGTPISHETLGMVSTLRVEAPPVTPGTMSRVAQRR